MDSQQAQHHGRDPSDLVKFADIRILITDRARSAPTTDPIIRLEDALDAIVRILGGPVGPHQILLADPKGIGTIVHGVRDYYFRSQVALPHPLDRHLHDGDERRPEDRKLPLLPIGGSVGQYSAGKDCLDPRVRLGGRRLCTETRPADPGWRPASRSATTKLAAPRMAHRPPAMTAYPLPRRVCGRRKSQRVPRTPAAGDNGTDGANRSRMTLAMLARVQRLTVTVPSRPRLRVWKC
jgi:hypothetical protein